MGTTCISFGRSGPCLWQFWSSLFFPSRFGVCKIGPHFKKRLQQNRLHRRRLIWLQLLFLMLLYDTGLGRRYPIYGSDSPLFRADSWHDGLVYRTHQWGTHQSSRHGGAAGDKEDLRGEGSALCGGTVSWSYNRSCILEGDYKKFATKAYILKDRKEFYTLCKTFYRRQ